jgi:hypothetical protein
MAVDHDARVDAIFTDAPADLVKRRSPGRKEPLSDAAIDKLAPKREPVLPSETHALWSVDANLEMRPVFGGTCASAAPQPSWH